MQSSLLKAEEVKKSFVEGVTEHVILQDVTVSFIQGKTYAITGVSGTGKSTLMQLLAGLDAPTSGIISFNDHALKAMSAQEHELFLQRDVGLLFQSPYLIKELSVLENCMMPAIIAGTSEDEARSTARSLLQHVGLVDKQDARPASLSGGQQARVALARALMNKPAFLLADEPTGNLDEATGKEIVSLLLSLQKEWKMGLIVSTHDTYLADAMETKYRLHDGFIQLGNE